MTTEADTRAKLIDPALREAGWDVVAGSRIWREFGVAGRLEAGVKKKKIFADYMLTYKNHNLAIIEAKSENSHVSEGLEQAKEYAERLSTRFVYATNGHGIYELDRETGNEGNVERYPTPDELWKRVFGGVEAREQSWRERFAAVDLQSKDGQWEERYYQHNAITKTLDAIAKGQKRILLTLATGTGKTAIAFQIAWKLFNSGWNLSNSGDIVKDGEPPRRPRILFLADRNILADQAFNAFNVFPEDALVRIEPETIRRRGKVPFNGSVFFTIFQTFMTADNTGSVSRPNFGNYPEDFFDFIIIDECHRGGANDESSWRDIMKYFSSAVQLGLTATPKRTDNADTYDYFGDPVYIYSLREGINDGYLVPFKVKQFTTTIDEYTYEPDDEILAGEIDIGRTYRESEFNTDIEIEERERKRVQLFMREINPREKTLVFCANQMHALKVRDYINQIKDNSELDYCVRVTANDGDIGDAFLRKFQDNERTIPTILTTSRKLSTGVDARNIRHIVLMRSIRSMIEFKQIIGRGTRLFDGKNYFTIYDFVGACGHFSDPEWDGEPLPPEDCKHCGEHPCVCEKLPLAPCAKCGESPCICERPMPEDCSVCGQSPCVCVQTAEMVVVKLADGKERLIRSTMKSLFYGPNGDVISAEQFIQQIFDDLPAWFKDEDELRRIWSAPDTRKNLLAALVKKYGEEQIKDLIHLMNAEDSDLYDVLTYIAYALPPISREARVTARKPAIFAHYTDKQQEFIDFVLTQYIRQGVGELNDQKLPYLIDLKYRTSADAVKELGNIQSIREIFVGFQKYLYEESGAS